MKTITAALFLTVLLTAAPAFAQQGTGTNYETRLSTLEDDMRALNGQVEQLNFAIHRIDQSVQRMQSDYDQRMSRLEAGQQQPIPAQTSTVSPPASVNPVIIPTPPGGQVTVDMPAPAPRPAPVANPNGTLGALRVQDGQVTGAVNNPQAPALPEAPADYGLTPQEQYDRAFGLLRQADYDQAQKAFKSFIDKNPKDKLSDSAKYWYAETLYAQKRFADAALAFVDAYQQSPQGPKAPDSLLKLAMSLAATNKTQDACTALLQIKNSYPNATPTVRARATEERTKLKCAS